MQRSSSFLLALAVTLTLTGCTLPPSSTGNPANPTGLSGNWQFTFTSTQSPYTGATYPVAAVFSDTSGAVSGRAVMQAPIPADCQAGIPCGFPEAYLNGNLTGTVGSSGNFTLATPIPSGSNVAPLTLTGLASGSSIAGTFALDISSSTDQGTISGNYIQPIDGTYTGTVVSSVTGATLNVTASLAQGTTLTTTAALPLTGTVNFSGSSCLSTTTVASGSAVLGQGYGLTLTPAGNSASAAAEGSVSTDAKTLTLAYVVSGGGCAYDFGTGTLTRP